MKMVEVRTAELIDGALNWAVAKAECLHPFILSGGMYCGTVVAIGNDNTWSPSTNWSQGGPLIEKNMVCFDYRATDGRRVIASACRMIFNHEYGGSESYLVAACRAIVAAKIGDSVYVPVALMS